MDFAKARGAAVLAALVMVACSSSSSTSSSNGGESSGDGGRAAQDQDGASSGSSGGSSGYDAAVDYDAAVAACAAPYLAQMQRTACCEQGIPRGYLALHVAEQDCLCGSSGPCTSACNYQDCMSLQASTPTCQSCLDTNLAGSCKATVSAACAGDPGCVAYQACVMG
jgi:hypothetical protein